MWALVLILAIIERARIKPFSKPFIGLVILIAALIVACRVSVGTDWETYVTFYYSGINLSSPIGTMEPGFTLIRFICYHLGLTHAVFFLVVSLISLIIYYEVSRMLGIRYFMTVLFVYVSIFFSNHQFSLVRHGLAVSIIWLAIAFLINGKVIKALITVIIASSIHMMAVFYIPFIFLLNKQLSKKNVFIMIAFSFICIFAQLSQKIISSFSFLYNIDRVIGYLTSSNFVVDRGLSLGSLFLIVNFVFFYFYFQNYYKDDSRYRIILNALFWCFVLTGVLNAFAAIITRVCNVLYVAYIFAIPLISENIKKRDLRLIFNVIMLLYLTFIFPKTFSFREETGESTLLPYRFDTEQLIVKKYY